MTESKSPEILVVDDTKLGRLSVKKILNKFDITNVDEVSDGNLVLKKLKEKNYDLVLMDILMPGKNGIESLQEMKTEGLDVPVVIISADIQRTTREKCLELGARAFVNKPVKPDQLQTILKDLNIL